VQSQVQFDTPIDPATITGALNLWNEFRDHGKFIPAALTLQNRAGQLVPFNLKAAQVRFLNEVNDCIRKSQPVRFIIDKTRRIGISRIISAIIFHGTPFFEGQAALILAHEKKAARQLFSYYHQYEQTYKPYLKIGLPRVTRRSASVDSGFIQWANRSSVEIATAKNLDFGRSFDFRFLHLSEAAYYPNIRGLMTALIGTIPNDPGTMVFQESTANGHNAFYKDCIDAMDGIGDYRFFFAGCFEDEDNWRDFIAEGIDPEKFEQSLTDEEWALQEQYNLQLEQLYWRRKKLEEFKGDKKKFDQEYPHSWQVSFAASDRQRFDPKLFIWMPTNVPYDRGELSMTLNPATRREEIMFTPHQYGELSIWKHPQPGGQYVGGVDVAKGVDINEGEGTPDPDWCVAEIGERSLGEQVAELHTRLEPTPFAQYLYDLGWYYGGRWGNWVYWVVEAEFSGGNGRAVLVELIRLGYPTDRLYFDEVLDEATARRRKEVGFVIRPNTRPTLIATHERFLMNRGIILHSKQAISEHNTFVKHATGKVEHQKGTHDDLVFGCMYLSWALDRAPVMLTKPKGPLAELPKKYGQGNGISEAEKQKLIREARMRNSIERSKRGDYT